MPAKLPQLSCFSRRMSLSDEERKVFEKDLKAAETEGPQGGNNRIGIV